MIRNSVEVEQARWKRQRERPLTQEQKHALFDAMYLEVIHLGRLDAVKESVRSKGCTEIARILNASI